MNAEWLQEALDLALQMAAAQARRHAAAAAERDYHMHGGAAMMAAFGSDGGTRNGDEGAGPSDAVPVSEALAGLHAVDVSPTSLPHSLATALVRATHELG